MSFDKPTRNLLANLVAECRRLLTADIRDQLQRTYGLQPDGADLSVASLQHLDEPGLKIAEELRIWREHLAVTEHGTEQERHIAAFERLAQETAFTALNRLAALRLCEERGHILECVRRGMESDGFALYERLCGGALGSRGETYRQFLYRVFDELAQDLGVLFDRRQPQSLVFPGERCLEDVLALLNDPALRHLWQEDETIGWIYQYYNSQEDRRRMRKKSAAPRNSHELAVRNQFFTPRYVVEFLTDNTLGRIWYEMTKGRTRLSEQSRYLVRRSKEIFLGDLGEAAKRLGLAGEEAQFPATVAAAYQGHFSEAITEEIGSYRWLIALAIPPSEYEKVTGDSLDQLTDYPHLNRIWDALDNQPDSPLLQDPAQILVAMGQFVLTSSGGPYAIEPTNRLWNAFKLAVQNRPAEKNLSQEKLLREPVFIPHRPLKDPREIRLLDPACGSMHFGLYAFDLFEVIYEEVWDSQPELLEDIRKAVTDKRDFLILVPKLIIEHNLHGIEIDPRCTQIAGLSLWLRAQKSWQRLGLRLAERPRIAKSNIVCAEPMPGEKELLREFTTRLESPAIGQLVDMVFNKMQLAGEAGSLLKIEEEIRSIVAEAKAIWKRGPKHQQVKLFGEVPGKPEQQEFKLDLSGIADGEFWEKAEDQIYAALRDYAEQAQNGAGYERRLFAEDAARGFAFIDLCRKRYDVALMNPPFGLEVPSTTELLRSQYPGSHTDLLAAFVARGCELANSVGAISSRSCLVRKRMAGFRTATLLPSLLALWDLGGGVMDEAMVQSCAYVLFPRNNDEQFVVVDTRADVTTRERNRDVFKEQAKFVSRIRMATMPLAKILYSLPNEIDQLLATAVRFEPTFGTCREGMKTFNNERFLRLRWEVCPSLVGWENMWEPYVKGGEVAPYWADVHLLLKWNRDGAELKAVNELVNGSSAQVCQASKYWRAAGCTYSRRNKYFAVRIMPEGCIFSDKGPAVLPAAPCTALFVTGWLNTTTVRGLVHLQANASDFHTGIVKALPWPSVTGEDVILVEKAAAQLIEGRRLRARQDEVTNEFCSSGDKSLADGCKDLQAMTKAYLFRSKQLESMLDAIAANAYGIREVSWLEDVMSTDDDDCDEESDSQKLPANGEAPAREDGIPEVARALSYWVGALLGRWDIRFATGEKQAPDLPDPFARSPVCSPGMLQNAHGLPAAPSDVPNTYSLRISWPGVLVDDHNHSEDIEHRIRNVIELIWKERAEDIERLVCEILDVKSVREYFNKPTGFFADHLDRYSKSRRQAPIYWPLSTASGSYTVWVYYHRLTEDFLYTVVNEFVSPKIVEVDRQLAQIETNLRGATGREATKLRETFEETKSFLAELQDFKAELLRVAALPYKPNLNDGVLITAAPLWKLFRLPKWRNDLKECWEQLEAGKYDWAHLAYSIWPERVREKCKKDRSLALGHGLETLCEMKPAGENAKPRRKRKSKATAPAEP